MLAKRKINENIFKCKEHQKNNIILCVTCQKNICLYCCRNSHAKHKIEYLNFLKRDVVGNKLPFRITNNIKIINDNFFIDLDKFKNKYNINLDALKIIFENEYNLLYQMDDYNNNKGVTFIDIENIKNIFKLEGFEKYINFFNQFYDCNSASDKIKYLKLNFPDILIEEKNIIEPEKKNKIYDIINSNIIPINSQYYIKREINNYFINIQIIKDISINNENFKYQVLFDKKIDVPSDENEIVLADNDNVEKELSFFILSSYNIIKLIINNLNNDCKYNIIRYNLLSDEFQSDLKKIGLIHLDTNKNIIFKNSREISRIYLYNDLFDNDKVVKIRNIRELIEDYFKICQNKFVFSIYNGIHFIKIENENINIDREIKFNRDMDIITFIYYNKNRKILFSKARKNLYLISLNSINPEIIQILDMTGFDNIKYRYYFFEEKSIYFYFNDNHIFYDTIYLNQFKIIDGELKSIQKIEIDEIKKKFELEKLYGLLK